MNRAHGFVVAVIFLSGQTVFAQICRAIVITS